MKSSITETSNEMDCFLEACHLGRKTHFFVGDGFAVRDVDGSGE
jgi:hypothetical protein